jgi:uncharacterized sporulation protein YeaH/YhbH (DUF444 family)
LSLRIDQDHSRFRNIVRGRIRQNLRKYISKGELLGRQGKDIVSIPIPQIDIPKLPLRHKQQGNGVAQGEGDPGDPLSGNPQEGDGAGQAGKDEGRRSPTRGRRSRLDELAEILGEELELPNIENKGKSAIIDKKDRYVGVTPRRPKAFGTSSAPSEAHSEAPDRARYLRSRSARSIIPTRGTTCATGVVEDRRGAGRQRGHLYMMDVSGSMGDEQKEIVRIESFWIDTWLRKQYKGVEVALHHPRCRRSRGRSRHVLPDARVRRAR